MGIMANGSLAHGLLTGAITPETTFEKDDWRRSLNAFGQPIFEGQNFLDNLKKVDRLKEVASAARAIASSRSSPKVVNSGKSGDVASTVLSSSSRMIG